jgi:hypothetical protein
LLFHRSALGVKEGLKEVSTEGYFALLLLSFVVSIVIPLLLDLILPPPVEWFPAIFKEIDDAQVEEAMREIMRHLRHL